ncbi:MAG: hypothetical protein QXF86_03185 [Candidatus Bilamarchaeaceae archaeon]
MEFQKLFPHGIPFEKKTQIFPINVYGTWWEIREVLFRKFMFGIVIGRKEGEIYSRPYKFSIDLSTFEFYFEPISEEEFWENLPYSSEEVLEEIEKELGEGAG